jgi:hypothetical protein
LSAAAAAAAAAPNAHFHVSGCRAVTTNYEELPWQICESCASGGGPRSTDDLYFLRRHAN